MYSSLSQRLAICLLGHTRIGGDLIFSSGFVVGVHLARWLRTDRPADITAGRQAGRHLMAGR